MSNISNPGTYRGTVLDHGLGKSSGGHYELRLTLQATEKYDEENQVWTPFNYEDSEAQAYLNLITSQEKKNPVNPQQIMRALGWDAMSWVTLNDPNAKLATQIQWRMGMETYNDVERCKVQGIAAYDAAPGRQLEKIEMDEAKSMDTRFAAILKDIGGGPKPKTARPKAPTQRHPSIGGVPDPNAPSLPEAPQADPTPAVPTGTSTTTQALTASSDPAPRKRGRPAAPKTPATPPPAVAAPTAGPILNQEEAWAIYTTRAAKAGRDKEGDTKDICSAWTGAVSVYGSDEAVGDNWADVAAKAAAALGV